MREDPDFNKLRAYHRELCVSPNGTIQVLEGGRADFQPMGEALAQEAEGDVDIGGWTKGVGKEGKRSQERVQGQETSSKGRVASRNQ